MKLKDLIRENLDVPMYKFCKKVKVSRTTIHNILNKDYKAGLLITKKICNYFNVDFRDYLEE